MMMTGGVCVSPFATFGKLVVLYFLLDVEAKGLRDFAPHAILFFAVKKGTNDYFPRTHKGLKSEYETCKERGVNRNTFFVAL